MVRRFKVRLGGATLVFLQATALLFFLSSCDADSVIQGKLVSDNPSQDELPPEVVIPIVEFSATSQSVGEGAGTATVTVELSAVSPLTTLVPLSVVGTSTASLGPTDDYTLSSTSISIPPGDLSGSITITLVDDSSYENPNEWIDLQLDTPTYAQLGSQTTHRLTITENDLIPLTVAAVYSTHSQWNSYVKNNNGGTNDFDQPDSDCLGSETGGYSACIHGGEKRKVVVTGITSCTGLTISESLSAFNWLCRVDGGTATFYSVGLKLNAGLGDLINSDRTWKNNSVTVALSGNPIAASSSSAWWNNNLVAPPGDTSTPSVIGTATGFAAGDIIVVNSNLSHSGFNINTDRIGMVVLPGFTLSFSGTAGCVWATGENKDGGVPEENCMFAAGNQKFLWIEGSVVGSGAGGDLDFGVLFTNVTFSRINRYSQRLGDDTGIGLNLSSNNKLSHIQVENFGTWANIWMEGSTYNSASYLQMAQSFHGLHLVSGSNNNTFVHVRAYNTQDSSNNFDIDASTDNTLVGVMSASSGNAGMHVKNGSDRATVSHYFSAHESDESVYMGADYMTLNQAVIVNNGDNFGGIYAVANQPRISQIVIANGNDDGLDWQASSGWATENILIGNMALTNCNVSGGSFPGITSACANSDDSNATWNVGPAVNLSSSFFGKVTSNDLQNTSDALGVAAYSNLLDWLNFDNLFRMWSADGSGFPNLDQTDTCMGGNCRIWDWRLSSSDTVIRNRSGNGSTANETFVAGSTCPSAVSGNRTLTDQNTTPRTFLVNAIEILADGVGNDNGLCESGDACIYSPNFGYYQGEGDYLAAGSCTFQNGTVSNVTMYAYPVNGVDTSM
ncbi:MAG: hypothetical protein IT288_00940 [Bdellovibrionales bacterium]|nr:hypothetical protein [Bdellovibrionales bacterium]